MVIDFENLDTNAVLRSVTSDGVRYLELFLKEYSRTTGTPENKLNAGCTNCISEYLKNYKLIRGKMAETKNYRLKTKYNGIALKFGSHIFVTNENINDEYAKILLERFKAEDIFEVYPKEEITVQDTENPQTVTEEVTEKTVEEKSKKSTSKRSKK